MICYLLFPEVLFHNIDKMEKKKDHEGVQRILNGMDRDFSIYIVNHFPILPVSLLLFICVVVFFV